MRKNKHVRAGEGAPSRGDSRVRGYLAIITALVFFGGPVVSLMVLTLGAISPDDLDDIVGTWTSYLGPIAGAVFGYYFGSSRYAAVSSTRDDS